MIRLGFIFYNYTYLLLILIVAFSFAARVYKIDVVPPSLSWDETAVGYNAFTIANWGKDEYGKTFPLYFRSFGEDKQPIHIYFTAVSVKLLGLSEFSTRIPAAVFGSLNVLIIFFLAGLFFKNSTVGLLSSLFLAVSPQNIFFSRFNHEANFALFFFMSGLLLFHQAIKGKKILMPFSFLLFFLSTISYHAAEIAVPVFMLLLIMLYLKDIYKNRLGLIAVTFLLAGVILLAVYIPQLFGIARYRETVQGKNDIEKTQIFKLTQNLVLGKISLTFEQYLGHFDPKFLFISGSQNSRLSSQVAGQFLSIDALFLIIGLGYLLYRRSRISAAIIGWALIGPLSSSLFAESPHAGRAFFMMGSWQIISALGFYSLINLSRKRLWRWAISTVGLMILFSLLILFLKDYFNEFPRRYAIDWQYGMKQAVEYVKTHKEYNQIYMTDVRSQPYIFFLYHLKTPLPEYLNSVVLNNGQNKSSNNVSYFGNYAFGGWNAIENTAEKEVLYILSPSEYDGLKYRSDFEVKNIVYYPNNSTAFYLVTLK